MKTSNTGPFSRYQSEKASPVPAPSISAKEDPRDKDFYLREYEILRQVTNVKEAIWQIVQMAKSEYIDEPAD